VAPPEAEAPAEEPVEAATPVEEPVEVGAPESAEVVETVAPEEEASE